MTLFASAHSRFQRAVAVGASAILLVAGLTVVTESVAPTSATAAQDPTQCAGVVSLTNGSFESPTIGNATYSLLDENLVPGWLTNDSRNQIEIWSNGFQGAAAATASIDLSVLATTGGIVTGLGWAMALLAVGALALLVVRVRRRRHAVRA